MLNANRQRCIGKGRRYPPPRPPSRAPGLCPGNGSLTPSASLNGICNRQEPPPSALATPSNRLPNRLWGHLRGPFPSNASLANPHATPEAAHPQSQSQKLLRDIASERPSLRQPMPPGACIGRRRSRGSNRRRLGPAPPPPPGRGPHCARGGTRAAAGPRSSS